MLDSCGSCDGSRSFEQLRKHVTDKYFEKEKALNLNHLPLQEKYITITIVEWLVSTWHICLTEGKEERCLRLSNYLNKFNVLWLLEMLYSALAFSGPQLKRQLAYKSWLGASDPDCHLAPKIGYLWKTEVAFKS